MWEGRMVFVIAEPCIDVKDTACVEVCPMDCIHPRKDEREFALERKLHIGQSCIDCAACLPACPVQAIFPEVELPEKWAHYAQIDADWYAKGEAAHASPAPPQGAQPAGQVDSILSSGGSEQA
jgi:ferredoxin